MRRLFALFLCLIGFAAVAACNDPPASTNVVVQPTPTSTFEPAPCPPRDRTPPGERPPDCP